MKYDDIAVKIDKTPAQLSGILGALGRRINNTLGIDGKPGINYLFQYVGEVNGETGTWGWRMRYGLRNKSSKTAITPGLKTGKIEIIFAWVILLKVVHT